MGLRIKCDKCSTAIGDVDPMSHGESTAPGGGGPLVNITYVRPAQNYNALQLPNGRRRIVCDACKTAFEALVAGY